MGDVEGEDSAGDVGEVGEAEDDGVGVDAVEMFEVAAFFY